MLKASLRFANDQIQENRDIRKNYSGALVLQEKIVTVQLDDKAWRLVAALQADGRQPLKALAQAASLSLPATAERLRRLEEAGVISGVHAEVSPAHPSFFRRPCHAAACPSLRVREIG